MCFLHGLESRCLPCLPSVWRCANAARRFLPSLAGRGGGRQSPGICRRPSLLPLWLSPCTNEEMAPGIRPRAPRGPWCTPLTPGSHRRRTTTTSPASDTVAVLCGGACGPEGWAGAAVGAWRLRVPGGDLTCVHAARERVCALYPPNLMELTVPTFSPSKWGRDGLLGS